MHPILVIGASGKTGIAVARQLLAAGHPVRALVHRPDRRSDALRSCGADVAARSGADPSLRPTLANRFKSLAEFAALPLLPAYDLERYTRRMQFVAPQQTEMALEKAQWIAERSAPAGPTLVRATHEHVAAMNAGAA